MKTSKPIKTSNGLYIQLQAHQKPNDEVLLYIKTAPAIDSPGESSCAFSASKNTTHPFRQTELSDGSLLISILGFGAHLDSFELGEFLEFITDAGLKVEVTNFHPGTNGPAKETYH